MKRNQKGFSGVEGLLILIIVGLVGFAGWYIWHTNHKSGTSFPKKYSFPFSYKDDSCSPAMGGFEIYIACDHYDVVDTEAIVLEPATPFKDTNEASTKIKLVKILNYQRSMQANYPLVENGRTISFQTGSIAFPNNTVGGSCQSSGTTTCRIGSVNVSDLTAANAIKFLSTLQNKTVKISMQCTSTCTGDIVQLLAN